MRLYIKQRVFSWGDKFSVWDERGDVRYAVQGEVFSWGKKLHIYDARGTEAAFIRQKVMSFMPRFYVEVGGRTIAEVVREFTLLRPSYRIEGPGWRVSGDFWAHEYSLFSGEREIMRMAKAWFTWGDSYELTIHDPRDELPCLAVALAVDCAVAVQNNH